MMWNQAGGERNGAGELSSSYGSGFGEISMCVVPVVALFAVLPYPKLAVRPNFSVSGYR